MRTSWHKRHVMRLVNKEKYPTASNGIAFDIYHLDLNIMVIMISSIYIKTFSV